MKKRGSPPATTKAGTGEAMERFVSRFRIPIVTLLMLVTLALCASDLKADPPDNLSWSTGPFTDDALNYYSARNMVLYGRWKVDEYLPFAIYPLANSIMALIFKLLGIGFVQVKLLSVLCAMLSVLVMYLLVKEDYGPLAGMVAALLQATCYPLVMYSRLAMAEPVQIVFLLLTGLFYVRGVKRPTSMLWCGLFAGAAVLLVKFSSAFLLPVIVIMLIWDSLSRRGDHEGVRALRWSVMFGVAGLGIATGIWLVIVYLPARSDYFPYIMRTTLNQPSGHPAGLVPYLLNAFTVGAKSRLFAKMPFVALLGFSVMPLLVAGGRHVARYFTGWTLSAVLMLGYMNYRPDRHELVLLPAFVACSGVAIAAFWQRGGRPRDPRLTALKTAAYAVWLWPLVTQLALLTNGFWGTLRPQSEIGLLLATFVVCIASGLLLLAATRLVHDLTLKSIGLRAALAAVVIIMILRLDIAQYAGWFSGRAHKMASFAADLDQSLPNDAVLTGWWAPQLLLSSKKRALFLPDWIDPGDPIARYGVTHVASPENGYDFKLFERLYPDLMHRAKVFREYEVRGIRLLVYELPKRGE